MGQDFGGGGGEPAVVVPAAVRHRVVGAAAGVEAGDGVAHFGSLGGSLLVCVCAWIWDRRKGKE